MARTWAAGGGGAAPPHTLPASWGAAPPRPPALQGAAPDPQAPRKGAPRPLLQRLVSFFLTKPLSEAAALPGAELFKKSDYFIRRSHLSRAAALPGADISPEIRLSLEETTCLGQLRCLGQNFSNRLLSQPNGLPPKPNAHTHTHTKAFDNRSRPPSCHLQALLARILALLARM